MIDHRRHHALETQKKSQLDGDENDGKDNSNNSGDESKSILQQVSGGELKDQRHGVFDRADFRFVRRPVARPEFCWSLAHLRSIRKFPWGNGAFANIRRLAPMSNEPNGTKRMAAVVAQARSSVPPKTIVPFAMANNAKPSKAYCSQTTNI